MRKYRNAVKILVSLLKIDYPACPSDQTPNLPGLFQNRYNPPQLGHTTIFPKAIPSPKQLQTVVQSQTGTRSRCKSTFTESGIEQDSFYTEIGHLSSQIEGRVAWCCSPQCPGPPSSDRPSDNVGSWCAGSRASRAGQAS